MGTRHKVAGSRNHVTFLYRTLRYSSGREANIMFFLDAEKRFYFFVCFLNSPESSSWPGNGPCFSKSPETTFVRHYQSGHKKTFACRAHSGNDAKQARNAGGIHFVFCARPWAPSEAHFVEK